MLCYALLNAQVKVGRQLRTLLCCRHPGSGECDFTVSIQEKLRGIPRQGTHAELGVSGTMAFMAIAANRT